MELGDIVTLHRGYDLPSSLRHDGPVPVVSSSGITGYHDEAKVSPPGVVTGRYGTLGEVFFVEEPFWPLNTTLYVSDFHGNDQRFISYFLRCQGLGSHDGAAAVPGINRNVVHRLPVRRPPVAAQIKIAAMLSPYDDLIENNNRRIKVLEDMAQRIYHEWFVDFRYPGHEDVPLVDSEFGPIPQRWTVTPLGAAVEFVYGKALKADARRRGTVTVFGSSGAIGHHDQALAEGPGIIVGRKGNVGSVYWSDGAFFAIDTTYWLRSRLPLTYCYYALREMDFVDSHAAVPGLSREQAYSQPLLVPDPHIAEMFDAFALELFALRRWLADAIGNFRAARDLLLPRLISGEIDVTGLHIAVVEPVA
ncbi:MAG: restriction endonuclease subunit S [Candidatus Acidiferrales bacterium]